MATADRLDDLLEQFRVRTQLFHTGPLCGVTRFEARPGRGFFHVLRRGEMTITHPGRAGGIESTHLDRASVLFYPRPMAHVFHNAPTEDSDFACATLDFAGGPTHPLVRALPPVIVLPLDEVEPLKPTLDLLFAEIDQARCGHRLLVDRLFEVVLIHLFRWLLDHPAEVGVHAGLLAGLSDERIAPALVAVHADPGADWSLTRMADVAHMSRSTFAARFRKIVGQPPAEYLSDWRLSVAQERLRAGVGIALVAAQLGYSSSSAFSRAFSQRLGCSPRAWLASAS